MEDRPTTPDTWTSLAIEVHYRLGELALAKARDPATEPRDRQIARLIGKFSNAYVEARNPVDARVILALALLLIRGER